MHFQIYFQNGSDVLRDKFNVKFDIYKNNKAIKFNSSEAKYKVKIILVILLRKRSRFLVYLLLINFGCEG